MNLDKTWKVECNDINSPNSNCKGWLLDTYVDPDSEHRVVIVTDDGEIEHRFSCNCKLRQEGWGQ